MKNNQKCVRLSDAVCALVEQQTGDSFSEKFGNLVLLAHESIPKVEAEKKRLEAECLQLQEKRDRLRKMIGDLQSLDFKQSGMLRSMSDFSSALDHFTRGLK